MSQQSSEVRKLLEGLMDTRTLRAVCQHGPIALLASVGVGINSALYGTRKPLKKLLPFAHGFRRFMPRSCYINKGSPELDDEFWMISVRKPSREIGDPCRHRESPRGHRGFFHYYTPPLTTVMCRMRATAA